MSLSKVDDYTFPYIKFLIEKKGANVIFEDHNGIPPLFYLITASLPYE